MILLATEVHEITFEYPLSYRKISLESSDFNETLCALNV